MELETETIPRKRKGAPNSALATEPDLEDEEPRAKKARLSSILFAENDVVTHKQLCELLKYAVLGKSTVPEPSWCQLLHQNHLNNVVVIILKGMSQLHFYRFYLEFRFLRKTFRHKFSLPPPKSSFLFDVIGLQKKKLARGFPRTVKGGPLTSAILKSSINLQNDPIIQKYGCEKVGLTRCLLTKREMEIFHFPLQGSPNCENFILAKCNGSITDNSPLFGLSCQMCLTSKGRELTRISLVAEGGHCIMDELVKPEFKIMDSFTSFSGITKKILNPVPTELKDVQNLLRQLLPPDAVLVGHSLDLDLKVLKMIHPYVIDTSLLYIGKQCRRFKLRFLAKVILGKDIQCPDKLGHDTIEEARTTLELVRYFLKYGPKKIAELNLEALASREELKAASQEPEKKGGPTKPPNMSVLECLDSMGQKLLFLTRDIDELSSSRNCLTIKCSSNKEVLEEARVEVPLFPFSIVQFSFEPFSPIFADEVKQSMKTKWIEMSTVYVGPFIKNCNIGPLKKMFKSMGPVQSVTLVLETFRPYFCVQYEVLEAAQLAIETMNGILVEGSYIRVHRPVTEFTLECDTLVRELEQDCENQGTIYVTGFGKAFKERLLEQSSLFPGLEAMILPKDVKSRQQKKYCFLKFKSRDSAQVALEILKGKDWKLKGRHALTPMHLQTWLKDIHPEPAMPSGLQLVPPLLEKHVFQIMEENHPRIVAWRCNRKIEKLYHCLSPGTLCLILLPGTNKFSVLILDWMNMHDSSSVVSKKCG
ncbi:RNA exonuclease 5 isoform X2 [Arvicola amphibius]|uniref:RNA exonuclease 5 isoform X2 n=1 Tax=Arvicola amphibius TaxID=1047088 RepID=UPI0018E36035|nr:RNA exonuclease 5 isoform X2 [Arvicola amphibius]